MATTTTLNTTSSIVPLSELTTSTSLPPSELDKILGKSKKTTKKRPRPTSKTVSWATEWTYHPYTPWNPIQTTGGSSQSSTALPSPSTSSQETTTLLIEPTKSATLDTPLQPPTRKMEVLNSIHTHVPLPRDIINIIKSIISTENHPPTPPEFTFELTQEAALRNFCVLQKYNGDIGKAIANQPNSPLSYGSEFRPTHSLKALLQHHPHWHKFAQLLTTGSEWPLNTITDVDRVADLDEALQFGNHKEATNNPSLLKSLVLDDVIQGFALPLPLNKAHRIQGILLAPLNITTQDTINELGLSVPKL